MELFKEFMGMPINLKTVVLSVAISSLMGIWFYGIVQFISFSFKGLLIKKRCTSYNGGAFEKIDTALTLKDAKYLVGEYRMSYGSDWVVNFYRT